MSQLAAVERSFLLWTCSETRDRSDFKAVFGVKRPNRLPVPTSATILKISRKYQFFYSPENRNRGNSERKQATWNTKPI